MRRRRTGVARHHYIGIEVRRFERNPVVFLNACQSAELSPYLYDGLVPYFIARGARTPVMYSHLRW